MNWPKPKPHNNQDRLSLDNEIDLWDNLYLPMLLIHVSRSGFQYIYFHNQMSFGRCGVCQSLAQIKQIIDCKCVIIRSWSISNLDV